MPTGTPAVANLAREILTPALEFVTGIQGAGVVSRGPGALPDFDSCAGPPLIPSRTTAGRFDPEMLPVPSFPNVPDPQHFISLLFSTAQVESQEACTVEAEYTEPA